MPVVRQIVHAAAPGDYRWSALVRGIVESFPFQMRVAQTPRAASTRASQQN
jgi:hypothetical protein